MCPQSLRSLLMPLLLLGALLQLTAAKAAKEDPNDCEGERRLCVHAPRADACAPQCVLTYHLKTQLHDLHTVKCITPPRVRLVRPR